MTSELCLDFEGGRYKVITLQRKCLRFGDVAAEQGKAGVGAAAPWCAFEQSLTG